MTTPKLRASLRCYGWCQFSLQWSRWLVVRWQGHHAEHNTATNHGITTL